MTTVAGPAFGKLLEPREDVLLLLNIPHPMMQTARAHAHVRAHIHSSAFILYMCSPHRLVLVDCLGNY